MSRPIGSCWRFSDRLLPRRVGALTIAFCGLIADPAWAREIWHCKLSAGEEPLEQDYEIQGRVVFRSPDDYGNTRLRFDVVEDSDVSLVAVHHQEASVILLTINKASGAAKAIGTNLSSEFVDVWEGSCTLR